MKQGSLFWLQNTKGEPLVGVFAPNHQPEVLPPYFVARKKNPTMKGMVYERIKFLLNAKYLRLVSNSMVKSLLTLDDE
jgi:hypothetical protein